MPESLSRLPLRVTLPLMVLAGSLLIIAVSLGYSDWTHTRDLIRETEWHAGNEVARLARIADDELDHDPGFVQREVILAQTGEKDPNHVGFVAELALVINPDGRILIARRDEWIGRPVADIVPDWDDARLERARATGAAEVNWEPDRSRMAGLMGFTMPPDALDGRGGPRRGAVFVSYDLRQPLRAARLTNLQRRLIDLPVVVLLAGLLALWLSRSFARPLSRLAAVARRIGGGELDVPVDCRCPGEVALLADSIRDMARQLGAERQRVERQAAHLRQLSQAVEQSPVSIVITDLKARIEYVNAAFVQLTGYSRDEVIGRDSSMLHSGRTPNSAYESLWEALKRGETWQGEFVNRRKDGGEFIEWAIVAPIHDADGQIAHYLAVKQDITEKRWAEAEMHRLAYVDQLTQLPNRALLLDRLRATLGGAQRLERQEALLLLNIDRFKTVNDALGHDLGDALLYTLGERLGGVLREGDTLARLSGDEFGILLIDLGQQREAANAFALAVAAKIQAALREPLVVSGERVLVGASLGLTLFPEHAEDTPSDILRRADMALHKAKEAGGNQVACFDLVMGEDVRRRYQTERELHQAIAGGELRVYLQSQVDADGRIVGAEALARWQHPRRGLLPPAVFIPIAEESELIADLDTWVLAEVCGILAREEMAGRAPRIAVNVSPRHFKRAGFCAWLRDLLEASGADPSRLTLEMTEGLLIDNIDEVVVKMHQLSNIGVHFSIDDFGTGYSSLGYLKRLPIHELKIDKGFVQDAVTDPNDAALVETILAVARHMHLRVVAEGVETAEQAAFLNERAKVFHQGYYYGRPVPAEEWLAHWRQGD